MINKDEARVAAWTAIADLMGIDYFLDYKTPDGKRMENPLKPISFA